MLLGERQELLRKLAHHVAVERYVVRQPETMNDILHRRRITSLFAVGPRSTVAAVSAGGKKERDAARHVKPNLRA